MAVTFPDRVHPKHGIEMRFLYSMRAIQFLEYFNIVTSHPDYKFIPLDLSFGSSEELHQFLYSKGIFRDEVEVSVTNSEFAEVATIVSTRKIYDVEESITKYLLSYKYYSINEVAEMLSFSRPTIYKLINEGRIKVIRINGQMRIKHSNLTEFINSEN
ncbi:helix-turn-helix domain-containing protein [Candidatus Dojkabacteria bacterium]|nr:helix-turn-helix domain-containing protein [Candidatus Dojkabacteria bacterium]